MKSPQRLVWSEGMLLSPQHLQSLDRAHEDLVAARVGALAPVAWGVSAVEFDAAALGTGEVRLLRFAGIFPDGLPLAFDEPESAPPPRQAADRFPATARSLDVHLAIPREREGVPSCAEGGAPSSSRFLAVSRRVQDATMPGAPVPIRFAHPNASILLGDESRQDHESIKIAEIVRGPGGQLALAESYVPPSLRIAASPWLLKETRDLLAIAIARRRLVAETQRNRESAAEVTGPGLARLFKLLVLDGSIPVLAHLAELGDASARECYLVLAQLAGQLCTFSGDDPATLPKLQHTDLRATFEPLFARLRPLVEGIGVQPYVVVPLEQRAGGVYVARNLEERVLGGQLFLTVVTDQPEVAVAERLPRLCKIAAASELQPLVQANAPGLPLQIVHRPPPQLPVKPDALYFALVPGDRYWQRIVSSRNLALFLPPPFDPARTQLELLAVPGEEETRPRP